MPSKISFDKLAYRYDLLNHVLSAGLDISWRKKTIKALSKYKPKNVLDVATGTGDLAVECAKKINCNVTGIDISKPMLNIARKKIKDLPIKLQIADITKLPFKNNQFDAITIGFGVRNFTEVNKSLKEIHRVLQKGKPLLILEASKPRTFPFKQTYNLYAKYIMPTIGGLISSKKAYRYLQKSTYEFMYGKELIKTVESAGFQKILYKQLTFGVCNLYIFTKK